MDTVIQFTLDQLVQLFLGLCIGITTVAGAVVVIIKAIQALKKPEKTQNERIEVLEAKVERIEQLLDNDNRRLNALEEGVKRLLKSNLAISQHLLDGNHTEELTKSADSIKDYLFER